MLRPGFISRHGGAYTPPAWLPTDLAGLQFWLAPAGLSGVDGDPISTWDDSGALNNDATQATSAKKPVIDTDVSPRAALFDNTDDQMDMVLSSAQKPLTAFGVVKVPNVDDANAIFGGDDAFQVMTTLATGLLQIQKSGHVIIASSSSAVPTAAFFYFVASYDASGNYVLRINGAAAGSGLNDVTFDASPNTRIGVGYGGTNFPFNGHIRHVGKYNVVVSGSDLTSLETYLAGQL